MPENSLSGGRYTVGKRFGASIQYVAVMAGSSSFCQQKQHPAATSIFHYRQTTHRAVRNKCWFCINIRRDSPISHIYARKCLSAARTTLVPFGQIACAAREQCLYGSAGLLVVFVRTGCGDEKLRFSDEFRTFFLYFNCKYFATHLSISRIQKITLKFSVFLSVGSKKRILGKQKIQSVKTIYVIQHVPPPFSFLQLSYLCALSLKPVPLARRQEATCIRHATNHAAPSALTL